MKILFIGELSRWSYDALSYLRSRNAQVTSLIWSKGMPDSRIIDIWRGDWILSFKSDLILGTRFKITILPLDVPLITWMRR